MYELPLWPPVVALALAAAAYFWLRHEGRKIDKRK